MLTNLPVFYRKLNKFQIAGIILSILSLLVGFLLVSCSSWFITATALTGLGVIGIQGYNIFLPSAFIRFLALAKPLAKYKERLYTHKITLDILSSSRQWIFGKILNLRKEELIKFRSSQILNELVSDIEEMDHFYLGMVLPWLSTGIIFLIAGIVFFFIISDMFWLLLFIFLFAAIIIPFLTYLAVKSSEERSLILKREINSDMISFLRGFADLRQFDLLGYEHNALSRKLNQEQEFRRHSKQQLAFWQLVQKLILQAGIVIAIFSLFDHLNEVNGPKLVLLFISIITLFEALHPFPELAYQFSRTLWCGSSLNKWNDVGEKDMGNELILFPAGQPISISGISIFYGSQCIFDQLCFKFKRGITAVTGCNGSGKTTLLDALCGLRQIGKGEIFFGERRLEDFGYSELISNIGYMEQQAAIFDISLFDNIAMAKKNALEAEVFQAAIQAGFDQALKQNPEFLSLIAGESGKNISGGQAKMISLARIILKEPPVVLLDEPTEGLDKNAEDNLRQLLFLWRRTKIIILVTHKKSLIEIADHNIILKSF